MPPKLKTEIVERSMFIFLPDRLRLLLNFSIPNKTFSLNVLFSAPCLDVYRQAQRPAGLRPLYFFPAAQGCQ